jgi:hypothetical protein
MIRTFYGLLAATAYGLGAYAAGLDPSNLPAAAQFLIASGVFAVARELHRSPKDPA